MAQMSGADAVASTLARMGDVPLDLIAHKVSQYASLASANTEGRTATPEGTLVALIRRFISDSVDFISVSSYTGSVSGTVRLLRATDLHSTSHHSSSGTSMPVRFCRSMP